MAPGAITSSPGRRLCRPKLRGRRPGSTAATDHLVGGPGSDHVDEQNPRSTADPGYGVQPPPAASAATGRVLDAATILASVGIEAPHAAWSAAGWVTA